MLTVPGRIVSRRLSVDRLGVTEQRHPCVNLFQRQLLLGTLSRDTDPTTQTIELDKQEDGDAAREQERRDLRGGRLDRRRGSPRVRSRGGEGPSRRSNTGKPRGGGRGDPLSGRSG